MPNRREWYTLEQLITQLSINERTFTANVRAGIFPAGVIRPGEKARKWDDIDAEWMHYRMAQNARFLGENTVGGETEEGC